jgi:hypothetical protein
MRPTWDLIVAAEGVSFHPAPSSRRRGRLLRVGAGPSGLAHVGGKLEGARANAAEAAALYAVGLREEGARAMSRAPAARGSALSWGGCAGDRYRLGRGPTMSQPRLVQRTRHPPFAPRRAFRDQALAAGVSIFQLARVMGASVKVIDRTYGHLAHGSEDHLRGPLDARSRVVLVSDEDR